MATGPKSYNQDFYKKYGIKITQEQIRYNRTPEEVAIIDKLNKLTLYDNPRVSLFEKAVKDYPHLPELKNYLYTVYQGKGKKTQAKKVLSDIRRNHPDYFFGIMHEIERDFVNEDLELANEKLKIPRSFESFFPDREIYDDKAFLTYQAMCIQYDLRVDDAETARKRHELMFDLDSRNPKTELTAVIIATFELANTTESFSNDSDKYVRVSSFPTVTYDPKTEVREFVNIEIEDFYIGTEDDLFEDEMDVIMALPRISLIKDLRKVVEYGIRSFPVDSDMNDFGDDSVTHAFYFLGALKDEGCLPLILDFFRQGEVFLCYWFGDYFPGVVSDTLYFIGKNQLDVLKDFLFESNIYSEPRTAIIEMLGRLAYQEPERKEEVREWITEVFEKMLELENDETIIDTFVIGELISVSIELGFKELEGLAEKAYQKDWLPDTFMGNWEVIQTFFAESPSGRYEAPLPTSIVEFYGRKDLDDSDMESNKALEKPELFDKDLQKVLMGNLTPHEQFIEKQKLTLLSAVMERAMQGDEFYEDDDKEDEFYFESDERSSLLRVLSEGNDEFDYTPKGTFRNTNPKVGRNDPCPCGSGKKHKKCCLNK